VRKWPYGDSESPATYEPASSADLRPLLQLAEKETDSSPVRAAVLALALKAYNRAHDSVDSDIRALNTLSGQLKHVFIPTQAPPRDLSVGQGPPEWLLKRGWAQIVARRDRLAFACAQLELDIEDGTHLPCGEYVSLEPDKAPEKWVSRHVQDEPTALVVGLPTVGTPKIFRDPVSGLPVVADMYDDPEGGSRVMHYSTLAPLALPDRSPLGEVILEGPIWIRTEDGALHIAPRPHINGLNYGYDGTCPSNLAALIDKLLDRIDADAVDHDYRSLSVGLYEGFSGGWGRGARLSRHRLLLARQTTGVIEFR